MKRSDGLGTKENIDMYSLQELQNKKLENT